MNVNDNIVVEFTIPLDSETRKEMAEYFKRLKLIHQRFVGKLVANINQGGITSVAQSVKMPREELKKVLAVAG